MEVFQDYAYYYNAFYHDKDYRTEAERVDLLLKRYGKDVKRVINFGCGTGKHDKELVNMGYKCMGIDMSQMMIDIAKGNVPCKESIDFSVADIRQYKTSVKYDAVISLFHVMSYQNTYEDILSAFQSARTALNVGGLLLFDVWYGPGVLSDKPVLRVKEVQNDKYRLIRIARPVMHDKTNIVDVCYEIFVIDNRTGETKTINEVHSMRYFFRPELESYLKNAGFELIDNLDCETLEATDFASWTSYFVARAV
ncbi:MAG: class I SAM-dependent methyltransferase [Lachnospiraceae bacterium]|nr:class I SAM-dependent methyltransferase [Lachnospiraceae bacterium]